MKKGLKINITVFIFKCHTVSNNIGVAILTLVYIHTDTFVIQSMLLGIKIFSKSYKYKVKELSKTL